MSEAFQTNNVPLAVTLFTCGVPFFEAEPGKPTPVLNIYTEQTLREMKHPETGVSYYKGWSLLDAAKDAWKRGRPGEVKYCFKGTPELGLIIQAYNQQEASIKEAMERVPGAAMGVATQTLDLDVHQVAAIACQLFANRKTLRDLWAVPVPIIAIYGQSRVETDGKNKVLISSFQAHSLNASDEIKRHLAGVKV